MQLSAKKFDLKESLKKALPYKPHVGKLKGFADTYTKKEMEITKRRDVKKEENITKRRTDVKDSRKTQTRFGILSFSIRGLKGLNN